MVEPCLTHISQSPGLIDVNNNNGALKPSGTTVEMITFLS